MHSAFTEVPVVVAVTAGGLLEADGSETGKIKWNFQSEETTYIDFKFPKIKENRFQVVNVKNLQNVKNFIKRMVTSVNIQVVLQMK